MMMALRLRQEHLDEIVAHAREGAPQEVCGLLPGRAGAVARVVRGRNVAGSPLTRYELDPVQQLETFQEMEAAGEDLVAIYHSHPFSAAYPSPVDCELAFYPDSVYVIVSLAEPARPKVRGFRVDRGGRIVEEELVIDV